MAETEESEYRFASPARGTRKNVADDDDDDHDDDGDDDHGDDDHGDDDVDAHHHHDQYTL